MYVIGTALACRKNSIYVRYKFYKGARIKLFVGQINGKVNF